ncbi:sensor histidine kinase [Virgibacillus proomii]|uniref:sensor histidine kinase n=1 Tax=Virgibacillus proomii TaxID=84407 RepID=UPI002814CE2E|nr:sensor histidine kinase [Virgibacillus proomii]
MALFFGRISLFSCIWSFVILFASKSTPFSISLFAISFALFCLLSLDKRVIYIYISLSVIAVLHMWTVGTDAFFINLYFYFLLVDATFRLNERQINGYLYFNLFITIFYAIINEKFLIEVILLNIFFYIFVIASNRITSEREELRDMYEQLLREYRKSKRMNVSAEREARLEERTKIARDIHDSVGHRLTALIMKMEILSIQNKYDDYKGLKQMATEALEETRQAVTVLQEEETEGIASVVQLIRKLEAESQLMVQFTIKQGVLSISLTNQKNIVLYRVVQEALTNAMRHSPYREVNVVLGKSAIGDVTFEIRNAIHRADQFYYGFGLTNMKKRIEEINGNVEIYQTNQQFVIAGTIPCGEGEMNNVPSTGG